jgi:hypothetical protein
MSSEESSDVHMPMCSSRERANERKKEREKKCSIVVSMNICMHVCGLAVSHSSFSRTNAFLFCSFFFYEFFTAELNIIDIDVFDRDLCVGENERKMKSIRDRKMRQHA